MALTCANCQANLPDDAAFCHKCGKATNVAPVMVKPRFCAKCGVLLPDDALFCLACGAAFTADETSWIEKHDEKREQELINGGDSSDVFDFEKTKDQIRLRAYKWAQYNQSRMSAHDWFSFFWFLFPMTPPSTFFMHPLYEPWEEFHFFPSNKPDAHKALVAKTMLESYMNEALIRRYIIGNEGNFSPTVITYFEYNFTTSGKPGVLADWIQQGNRI